MDIQSNNIKSLQLYGNFLCLVVSDVYRGQEFIDKALQIQRSFTKNNHFAVAESIKYGGNENAAMFMIDGNIGNLGIITNCNEHASRIFGFTKNELIGSSINLIQPKVLAINHDKFMNNFFDSGFPTILGIERIVLPVIKADWVIPTTVFVYVVPNLEKGLLFIGFLRYIKQSKEEKID